MSSSIPPLCLPSRPSSRPRPVIISYRIPDDIKTQSITCDTGYDDIQLPPRPSHRSYLLPAPLPAEPCRQTGRLKARRHPVCYSPAYLSRSISSAHLFLVACLPYPPHAIAPCHPFHAAHPSHPLSPHLICSSPVPFCFPFCFPPSVQPRLVPPNFSPCFQHVACQSHPPRPSYPSHSSHRLIANAPSDKTSDEQAKRRT